MPWRRRPRLARLARPSAPRLSLSLSLSLWVGVGVGLTGCGDKSAESKKGKRADSVPKSGDPKPGHVETFDVLLPKAEQALRLASPADAALMGHWPMKAPPITVPDVAAVRTAVRSAWVEAEGIDPQALTRRQRAMLTTIRFGLSRAQDHIDRHDPTKSDPTVYPYRLGRSLDVIERRLESDLDGDLDEVLTTLAEATPFGVSRLTSASLASATHAATLYEALAQRAARLEAQGAPPQQVGALVEALNDAEQAMQGVVTQLEAQGPKPEFDEGIVRKGERVARLPDAIGGRVLVRRLGIEEDVHIPLEDLLEMGQRNRRRYASMQSELGDVAAPGEPEPVTQARCEQRWAKYKGFAEGHGGLVGALDCEHFVAWLPPDAGLTTPDLDRLLLARGVVEPTLARFRAEQHPTIGLVSGRSALPSHTSFETTTMAIANGKVEAAHNELERAQQLVCQAGVALWVHADLGTDEQLARWYEGCPVPLDQARTLAFADPRGSLEGLGLLMLPAEMHLAVGLHLFGWSPLGLLPILADPNLEDPDQTPSLPGPDGKPVEVGKPVGVQVDIEVQDL